MEKTLTLIIPTYNMEKYLRKCLDSVIINDDRVFETLEVLVVIDGSKDSSSSIAHEYQDRYPHVFKTIDKDNGNYGSCINRGLIEAKGKYVKVLDADDSFNTNVLQETLLLLEKLDVDLVLTDHVAVRPNGTRILRQSYNLPTNSIFTIKKLSKRMREYICMHDIIYKLQNLKSINYFQTEGISYTDQEWLFLPMTNIHSIWYFPKPLYKYLLGREGQTMDNSAMVKMMSHNILGFKTMLKEYQTIKAPQSEYYTYIHERLLLRAHLIYFMYLTNSQLDLSELTCFDEYIKNEDKDVYNALGAYGVSHRVNYKYIGHWRRNKKCRLPKSIMFITLIDNKLSAIRRRVINTVF